MSNPYYDSTGYPQTGASGSSASMRAEFDSIEAGFNKLPTLAGNGGKLVKINSAANALETSNVISENGINATISGDLTIAGGNVGVDADSLHTIPNVAADTLTLNAATQTLTNKTIVAASNTITTAAVGNLTSTNLNAALAELQADIDTRSTISSLDALSNTLSSNLSNHINDTDDAHDASAVSNAPSGNLAATNVQAALNELQGDIDLLNPSNYLGISGGSLTGLLNLNDGTDIPSASTVDLTAATGNTVRITGTTAITAFTMNAGQQMELIAVGALPLTYNATTMNINGGVSYTCSAGDRLSVTKDGSGVVRVNVTKQDGSAVVASGLPVGTVIYFASSSAPSGYLKANGALVSRTTYSNLFTAIGTTFGVGDGSTTFALPDLRGEFIRGWDDGRGVDTERVFGSSQTSQNLAHTHTVNALGPGGSGIGGTGSVAASTSSLTTSSIGGTESRPRNVALLACIKY